MSNQQSARLSIDVEPTLRTRLKIAATRRGKSLRDYCVQAIARQLEEDEPVDAGQESAAWTRLSANAFARDWDSKEDAVYDSPA